MQHRLTHLKITMPNTTKGICYIHEFVHKNKVARQKLYTAWTEIILYLLILTYSMEQSPAWEATGYQLVKKCTAFYGKRRFTTAVTSARHLFQSCVRSVQSMSPSRFLKIHLNIILPSTPGCFKWSLSFRFPHQNPVYASPPHALHAPPISFFSIWLPEQYWVRSKNH